MSVDPKSLPGVLLKAELDRALKEAQYAAVREDYLSSLRWVHEADILVLELHRRSHLRLV